jgi:hypothetical protein
MEYRDAFQRVGGRRFKVQGSDWQMAVVVSRSVSFKSSKLKTEVQK